MSVCYALVGAPNCGKTALFNALTGARAKVANYAGATVDRRSGRIIGSSIELLDLPGTYSLHTTSPDEAITRDVLLGVYGDRIDGIIAVADATNLAMTLRMVLELRALAIPMIIALNLSDVADARGLDIDTERLSQLLGVPVIKTAAIRTQQLQPLRDAVALLPQQPITPTDPQHQRETIANLSPDVLYKEVSILIHQSVHRPPALPRWHQRLDRFVLHPVWGMLLLSMIIFLVFQAVYSWAAPVMDGLSAMVEGLAGMVESHMSDGLLRDLLVNGVIAGVGSVVVFLPQITILFAFILLLEDSGYLPRAAFLLDNLLSRSGLSGRAFIPLLSSFACAVPAIISTRTIADPRERLVTIAIAPLMTCSARLPVYALIISAVIPNQTLFGIFNLQGVTLFALYMIAIISAVAVAWYLKKRHTRSGKVQIFPLLMELPTYRWPNARHILLSLWEQMRNFLLRAGTIIFALSVILWVLVTFPSPPAGATEPAINYSFAGTLGQWLLPIFAPLGFNWQMCIAMVPGLAAREVVVAALGTVYAVNAASEDGTIQALNSIIGQEWGISTGLAFLTWYIYAPMCLATIAVIRRETASSRTMWAIIAYLTLVAYVAAWSVYHLSQWLLGG